VLVVAIGYYAGGYVAGRMSRFDGGRQGFGAWAIGLIMTIVLAAAGAIAGSEYNLLGDLDLPRIPINEGSLATGGGIALALILIAAVGGGKVGERYHRQGRRCRTPPEPLGLTASRGGLSTAARRRGTVPAAEHAVGWRQPRDASAMPSSGVFCGHSGIEEFFGDWLASWTDYQVEFTEYLDLRDGVVVGFRQASTGRSAGCGSRASSIACGTWTGRRSSVPSVRGP
jgi:hypothetical protein